MSVKVEIIETEVESKLCEGAIGHTLYDILSNCGIDPGGICGGRGYCGKCKLEIVEGVEYLSETTEVEKHYLSSEELSENVRLACQAKVLDKGRLRVKLLYEPWVKAVVYGLKPHITYNPAIRSLEVDIPHSSIERYNIPAEIINENITKMTNCSKVVYEYDTLQKLSDILIHSRKVCVIYRHYESVCEVIDVHSEKCENIFGLILDIGTTKVAYKLLDLHNGSTLYAGYFENPQTTWGADIISRLAVAIEKSPRLLSTVLVNEINKILDYLSWRIDKSRIYEIVAVGNTAMIYLLLGFNVRNLAVAPYEIIWKDSSYIDASDVGLRTYKKSKIYIPPQVGGFIGSDALVGAFIAWHLSESKSSWLFMDIGTNSEIFLYKDGAILATSTASGPAFEGMHISCGVRSVPGAIEKIKIEPASHQPIIKTILNKPPIGIAGTGMIDLVAELLRNNIITKDGKMLQVGPRVTMGEKQDRRFIVAYKGEFGNLREIYFNQKDVREIQKAVGAIKTGIKILLKIAEAKIEDLSIIYLAGSFGSAINVSNAKEIGLLPPIDNEKIKFAGNTALSGAEILLLNKELRDRISNFRDTIKYVELATLQDFNAEFVKNLVFGW